MDGIRKSHVWIFSVALGFCGLALFFAVHPALLSVGYADRLSTQQRLAAELEITDLCLFTEARYARHLSQADWHSPFQDHPTTLDYFPSGSVVSPPPSLRGNRHAMAEETD